MNNLALSPAKKRERTRTQSDCYCGGERERAWSRSLCDGLSIDENSRSSLGQVAYGRLSLGASSERYDVGRLSERASEIMDDAKVVRGGKELKLYQQKLSIAESNYSSEAADIDEQSSMLDDVKAALEMSELEITEVSENDEPALLTSELAEWEGFLSKRSEWLRRWEKQYYVLEGKTLRRRSSYYVLM